MDRRAVRVSFQTVPTTRKIEAARTPIDLTAHSANSRQKSAKSHPGAILLSRLPASSSTEAQHMGLSLNPRRKGQQTIEPRIGVAEGSSLRSCTALSPFSQTANFRVL